MSIETVKMVDERPDWLDGATDIELSTHHLRAYWDADILDIDDRNKHDTIIERRDPFEFRFRVYLRGRVWKCICAHWCFDVGFTSIGDGQDFNLSDVLRTMQVWSGWDAAPVCEWMRGQLDQAADAGAQPAEEPPTEEPAAEQPRNPPRRGPRQPRAPRPGPSCASTAPRSSTRPGGRRW